jgi:hypothetical protein
VQKPVAMGGANMEWLRVLKDYVPLFQTIIWALLLVFGFILFRKPLKEVLESLRQRIGGSTGGGSVEVSAGFFSLKLGELRDLPYVKPTDDTAGKPTTSEENKLIRQWSESRNEIYLRNRDVFLAHILQPSKKPHQKFDIFIFLIRHEGVLKHEGIDSSIEIDYAEFFLGKTWGNRVFKVQNEGGPIGLSTSAYGTFLVVCRLVFKDGYEVILDRYIDFEMGKQIVEPVSK